MFENYYIYKIIMVWMQEIYIFKNGAKNYILSLPYK